MFVLYSGGSSSKLESAGWGPVSERRLFPLPYHVVVPVGAYMYETTPSFKCALTTGRARRDRNAPDKGTGVRAAMSRF